MKRSFIIVFFILLCNAKESYAQKYLPEITVINRNNKIIISWLHRYSEKISDILIQRSYDSTKKFTTIGTVLNPQNLENGYPDLYPPYNRMYYRVTVIFQSGKYIIGTPTRPVKEVIEPENNTELNYNTEIPPIVPIKFITEDPVKIEKETPQKNLKDSTAIKLNINKNPEKTASKSIYNNKKNNLIIELPEASGKKYTIKFFEESGKFLFQLNNITEEYLIIEKVNFKHSGWFNFELYDQGILIEKNKIFVPKDPKISDY